MNYSVLMSVYYSDNPDYLKQAIDSMLSQTVKPDEIILVCDGPLTPQLDDVVHEYEGRLCPVPLKENRGLGEAMNIGLQHCRNELVARMDSDDISLPDRCERQLGAFRNDPALGIISGTIEEFSDLTGEVMQKRKLPSEHEEIVAFSRRRCPFNHPAVMYKKSAVIAAGGYTERFHYNEDYDLWFRMLKNGTKSGNLPQVLVKMRVTDGSYRRRGGREYAGMSLRFYGHMRKSGWISRRDYVCSALPQAVVCMLPNGMRKAVYRILRSN